MNVDQPEQRLKNHSYKKTTRLGWFDMLLNTVIEHF